VASSSTTLPAPGFLHASASSPTSSAQSSLASGAPPPPRVVRLAVQPAGASSPLTAHQHRLSHSSVALSCCALPSPSQFSTPTPLGAPPPRAGRRRTTTCPQILIESFGTCCLRQQFFKFDFKIKFKYKLVLNLCIIIIIKYVSPQYRRPPSLPGFPLPPSTHPGSRRRLLTVETHNNLRSASVQTYTFFTMG
jgi:hypothetical protein